MVGGKIAQATGQMLPPLRVFGLSNLSVLKAFSPIANAFSRPPTRSHAFLVHTGLAAPSTYSETTASWSTTFVRFTTYGAMSTTGPSRSPLAGHAYSLPSPGGTISRFVTLAGTGNCLDLPVHLGAHFEYQPGRSLVYPVVRVHLDSTRRRRGEAGTSCLSVRVPLTRVPAFASRFLEEDMHTGRIYICYL